MVETEIVERYDPVVYILSGERTRKVVEILKDEPKTLSEIMAELPDEIDYSDLSHLLSALKVHGLVQQEEYKFGESRGVASMSFVLNREKLVEYVGKLRELTSFYEKLL